MIQYIEKLEKLRRLQVLDLSHNMIQKMEKLEKLFKLRELNLAYNRITQLEGLETLLSLQVLDLTGNRIQNIPSWLGKKLKALHTLRLGDNNLQGVRTGQVIFVCVYGGAGEAVGSRRRYSRVVVL